MHEYSIAYDIFATARRTALDHNARCVNLVRVSFGQLAMVNPDQVSFLFDMIKEDDLIFTDTRLICEFVPASTRCSCGYEGDEIHICPICGKLPSIISGKEIVVKNIEIEAGDP